MAVRTYSNAQAMVAPGGPTFMDPAQAVLASESVLIQSDLLAALGSLEALSGLSDPADIESYKAVIVREVSLLVEEFSRLEGPRPARVRVLLGGLLGWSYALGLPPVPVIPTGDVAALRFLLNLGAPVVRSARVEDQVAAQGVVAADAAQLFQLWVTYQYALPPLTPPLWLGRGVPPAVVPRPVGGGVGGLAAVSSVPAGGGPFTVGSGGGAALRIGLFAPASGAPAPPALGFAASVATLDLLLPVLTFDTDQVSAALDAVGYGLGAQAVNPMAGLTSHVDDDLGFVATPIPISGARTSAAHAGLTVTDVLDWAGDLSSSASYDLVRDAGQLGIDLLADQADELFWIVLAMLTFGGIAQIADPQVQAELTNMARDLDTLANLCN
jgi:hypothetical protein